jgi:hypothetical protein
MKIGDKVWVITQADDDGLMVALPEVPKSGTINSTEWCREKEFYYVRVDNDTLYVWPSNIFLSEDIAWAEWKYRMKNKSLEIQKMIDNRSHR